MNYHVYNSNGDEVPIAILISNYIHCISELRTCTIIMTFSMTDGLYINILTVHDNTKTKLIDSYGFVFLFIVNSSSQSLFHRITQMSVDS